MRRRNALEVPDVADRGGELDVAHAVAAHLGARDLDAAALADDALEADALVLAAVALPVLGRTEDLLAEESVLLRLERAVVDGLGLLDLAARPLADLLRARESDAQSIEVVDVDVEQCLLLLVRQHVGTGRLDHDGQVECRNVALEQLLQRVHRLEVAASVVLDAQVEPELLGGLEDVFVLFLELDLLAGLAR